MSVTFPVSPSLSRKLDQSLCHAVTLSRKRTDAVGGERKQTEYSYLHVRRLNETPSLGKYRNYRGTYTGSTVRRFGSAIFISRPADAAERSPRSRIGDPRRASASWIVGRAKNPVTPGRDTAHLSAAHSHHAPPTRRLSPAAAGRDIMRGGRYSRTGIVG
ncbi:unnamed protein product [Nesidiocoris tenuis]|uniref:Uncharacterized protein n=1 Tax=Nesidiocoris tenuis TaxID=355587 RepID=A0A6H5HRA0_9HEMI|nr:unnamed protein product [Nesidiocoris tenuis]